MIGKTLGHYRIASRLGKGGMGEVYLAEDTKLNRKVALKVLPTEVAQDPERRRRFEREAQAVAALNHPNIVTVHSVEEAEGVHFITMELVEGKTLSELIPKDGLPLGRFFELAVPLADAISAAHERGITHRDLKPDNVMVTGDGRVKVLDFGLAKLMEEAPAGEAASQLPTATATEPGRILGTVAYMSPEQAQGKPVDHRSDVFSLGVVLYAMATGRHPFEGDTPVSILSSVLKDNPPSLTELKPALPKHLGRIVRRCLHKDPERRYQTAKDIRNEMEELKREMDSGELHVAAPAPQHLSRLWIAGTAVATVAVLAAVVAFVMLRRPSELRDTGPPASASLAVLPFDHPAGDSDAAFLSEAIADTLSTSLLRVRSLQVRPLSSVLKLKGESAGPSEAGRKLQVGVVVTGTIRKHGENLLITCQLIDVASNSVRWGESFSRKQTDLIQLQQDLATLIASKMSPSLTGEERMQVAGPATSNLEAFRLYVLGRNEWNKFTEAGFRKSIEYYEEAIKKDKRYALAYSGLADSYNQLGVAPKMAFPKVKEYAELALSLDPNLAEAHVSLGTYQLNYARDWAAAKRELDRAIELRPNYADAYHFRCHYFEIMGRFDEAFAAIRRAQELDPTSSINKSELGWAYYHAGRFDDAIRQYEEVVRSDPRFSLAVTGLAEVYSVQGRHAEAIDRLKKVLSLDPDALDALPTLGHAYAAAGNRDEAERILLRGEEPGRYMSPFYVATIYVALGETDKAFEWLDRACEERDGFVNFLKVEAKLAPLRSDPRFAAIVRRVGLP